jgi:hypothetical protein
MYGYVFDYYKLFVKEMKHARVGGEVTIIKRTFHTLEEPLVTAFAKEFPPTSTNHLTFSLRQQVSFPTIKNPIAIALTCRQAYVECIDIPSSRRLTTRTSSVETIAKA